MARRSKSKAGVTHPGLARDPGGAAQQVQETSSSVIPGNGALAGPGMQSGIPLGRGSVAAPIPLKNLRTFTSFSSPVFRLFYGSMLGQMAAMHMELIARSYLIYQITHSATILGVMALANSIPMLFLSLYGGVMADRVQKKYLLLMGQLGSGAVALSVALLLTSGYLSPEHPNSWWVLVVVSMVKGSIQGFVMPARSAIIPEVVRRDQIMNAVALNNFGTNVLRILAPALAGFFIDFWGYVAVYYFMTGLYAAAAIFVALMPLTGAVNMRRQSVMEEMRKGFQYIRHDTTVLQLLVFTLFVVLFSMPYMQLLPVFAEDILAIGAKGMGILVSASGVGAIVGSLVLASLLNKRRGALLLCSGLVLGMALAAFAFSRSLYLSLAVILFVGLGQAGRMTLSNALLQSYSQEQYLGRVMSIYNMEFGLTSFSVFLAGLLADTAGVQWSVGGMAVALVALCILVFAFSPRLRRLQ